MPDDNKPNTPVLDPAANNADVAQKLNNQDTTLKPSKPEDLLDAGSALDALAAKVKPPVADDPPEPKPPVVPKAKDDKPDVTPAAPAAPVTPVVEDPNKKKADELFKDSPALPHGASPKSSEAFNAVKIKAAQEISAREQKLAEAEKKNKELEEKLKNPVPDATAKELEDLRQFRARLDVEADPKFKEFEKTIDQTREFIYAQLKTSPAVTVDTIEAIKKYGGPENVNLTKLFEAINDPSLQRIVDSAITDIEKAKFNKQEAIKAAKANINSYVAERQKEYEQTTTAFADQTRQHLTQYVGKLEWLAPKTVAAGADDAAKKDAEAHNAFVADVSKNIEEAIRDDSADMRAILITGMAQLIYTQKAHEAVLAKNKSLEAEVAKLTEAVNKFKNASTTRLREHGAAPGSGGTPAPKTSELVNMRAGDALDDIAKRVAEERAAKANGQ